MLATKPSPGEEPAASELAASYCDALLAVTPANTPRPLFLHALKLALVEVSRSAVEDGSSCIEDEAVFYEGVANRIRLTL